MTARQLVVALLFASSCRAAPQAVFTELTEGRRVAADLRVQMTKMVDASNRAVMADSDEASRQNAREADHLAGFVKSDVAELEPRLRRLENQAARKALDDFERQFAEYEKADRQVLELAVENTNLKAQRLSFGAGREAADAFRDAMDAAAAAAPVQARCRDQARAAWAVAAVREVQTLWAPHIAEREDAAMTRFEGQIAALQARAGQAVAELGGPDGAKARAALDRFVEISRDIVRLSRRNTNVVSLDLALKKLPALTAACDESLRVLGEALAQNPFPATK